MAKNYIKVSQVVNDFIVTQDHDDYVGHVPETSVRTQALRGVREMGFDMLQFNPPGGCKCLQSPHLVEHIIVDFFQGGIHLASSETNQVPV